VVIPVLEDTMEQSLALAASMESRGFGARPERSRASRRRQRAASLAGLGALSFGSLELAMFGATWPSLVALAAGPILLVFAIRTASLGSKRTHLEPLRFGALDLAIVGGGLALVGASALLANATNGAWPL
jgi:energy-coupling factor transport system permease protein